MEMASEVSASEVYSTSNRTPIKVKVKDLPSLMMNISHGLALRVERDKTNQPILPFDLSHDKYYTKYLERLSEHPQGDQRVMDFHNPDDFSDHWSAISYASTCYLEELRSRDTGAPSAVCELQEVAVSTVEAMKNVDEATRKSLAEELHFGSVTGRVFADLLMATRMSENFHTLNAESKQELFSAFYRNWKPNRTNRGRTGSPTFADYRKPGSALPPVDAGDSSSTSDSEGKPADVYDPPTVGSLLISAMVTTCRNNLEGLNVTIPTSSMGTNAAFDSLEQHERESMNYGRFIGWVQKQCRTQGTGNVSGKSLTPDEQV